VNFIVNTGEALLVIAVIFVWAAHVFVLHLFVICFHSVAEQFFINVFVFLERAQIHDFLDAAGESLHGGFGVTKSVVFNILLNSFEIHFAI